LKIAFVGADSLVFTKNLPTDIPSFTELRGASIALHDISPERLETAGMMARWTSEQLEAGARVEEHPDLRGALEGADFVINMVQIGMHEATLVDFEVPKRYGLKQTITDSMGIGGIFRGLRRATSSRVWTISSGRGPRRRSRYCSTGIVGGPWS
jgi:alpha-galactosidase